MQLLTELLPEAKSRPLSEWLDLPQFDTLLEVLQSRAFEHEFAAMKSRLESESGTSPNYELKAKDDARNADMTQMAIKMLKELQKTKVFKTTTAQPD